MSRVYTVVGARPQFIKAAAVSREFRNTPGLSETLVHTGQHYDSNMSSIFFQELDIPPPAHHLNVGGGMHGAMTGQMVEALERLFVEDRPDLVLVYGDTNSTLAAALAAVKLHIPLAHVEAGLRSFNKAMPEEINRILTDHCAEFLFTPTPVATKNLLKEGMPRARLVECGDVMLDACLHFAKRAEALDLGAKQFGIGDKEYVLATVHRQENTDHPDRLSAIIEGLARISVEIPVILPLHPRTKARIDAHGLHDKLAKIIVTDPLGYLEMVSLEKNAAVIATDSGGVQKEAFFHQVPCVTLRDETEWTELVVAGWNYLTPPTSSTAVFDAVMQARGSKGKEILPYGKGNASKLIVRHLQENLASK